MKLSCNLLYKHSQSVNCKLITKSKRFLTVSFKNGYKRQKDIDPTVLSVFDMYTVGIGPSSSHTVGPMRAANNYTKRLISKGIFDRVYAVHTDLYGSLALTGEGHGTPKAILTGLEGNAPETADPDLIIPKVAEIRTKGRLMLGGTRPIKFENNMLRLLKDEVLPFHSNGIMFTAYSESGQVIDSQVYYSIGGGFVLDQDEVADPLKKKNALPTPPFMFHTGEELLHLCQQQNCSVAELQMENEVYFGRTVEEVEKGLLFIWDVMNTCIDKGLNSKEKILPGGLRVKRRAPDIFKRLESMGSREHNKLRKVESELIKSIDVNTDTHEKNRKLKTEGHMMDWISVYAMAVNEENAAGGKVVTAPTNGAAGVIPAVLRYWIKWASGGNSTPKDITDYLLTAAAIGMLFKKGASISAAEVGCQGEIGVACSMAAAGICGLYGGSPIQVANAAEIGMEHNLGMTCDPIGGLVQIPCIERNTMGSIKAVNAARLAMLGDDSQVVSLDTVISAMISTGQDMQTKYKETSTGGLAIHIGLTEC